MAAFGKEGIVARLSQLDGDLLALYPDHGGFDLVIVGAPSCCGTSLQGRCRP